MYLSLGDYELFFMCSLTSDTMFFSRNPFFYTQTSLIINNFPPKNRNKIYALKYYDYNPDISTW